MFIQSLNKQFANNSIQTFHFKNYGEFDALNFVMADTYSQVDRQQHGPEDLGNVLPGN